MKKKASLVETMLADKDLIHTVKLGAKRIDIKKNSAVFYDTERKACRECDWKEIYNMISGEDRVEKKTIREVLHNFATYANQGDPKLDLIVGRYEKMLDKAEEEIKGLFEEIDMVIRNNHYRWFDETCQRGLIKALKDWWHTK